MFQGKGTIIKQILLPIIFSLILYFLLNVNGIREKKPIISRNTIKFTIVQLGFKTSNRLNEVKFTFTLKEKTEFKIKNFIDFNTVPQNPHFRKNFVTRIGNLSPEKREKKQAVKAFLEPGTYELTVEILSTSNVNLNQEQYVFLITPIQRNIIPKKYKWYDIIFQHPFPIVVPISILTIWYLTNFLIYIIKKKKEKKGKKKIGYLSDI